MIGLIVHMHIRPLHIRQALELDLEFLCDVVGGAQGGLWVHDDVDFDNQAGPRVVGADGVDLQDSRRVCHC